MSSQSIVELHDLSYKVGHTIILNQIKFKAAPREHWVLFGGNGCGKTTLLSIIAGYKSPTSGMLRIFGDSYRADNILAYRSRIGLVSSSYFDTKYCYEQSLDIVLSGLTGTFAPDFNYTGADVRRAKALLAALELKNKIHEPYCRLSKGQRQNVLIARAFMSSPALLLLDEPCSGLDVLAKSKFMHTLDYLAVNTPVTLIYATHDLSEINPHFSKTMLLRNGGVFAEGETENILTSDIMSRYFDADVSVQKEGFCYNAVVKNTSELNVFLQEITGKIEQPQQAIEKACP